MHICVGQFFKDKNTQNRTFESFWTNKSHPKCAYFFVKQKKDTLRTCQSVWLETYWTCKVKVSIIGKRTHYTNAKMYGALPIFCWALILYLVGRLFKKSWEFVDTKISPRNRLDWLMIKNLKTFEIFGPRCGY